MPLRDGPGCRSARALPDRAAGVFRQASPCDTCTGMKRGSFLAFVLGAVIGSGATYFIMRAEVQRAVAEATEKVGKTVKDVGKEVEQAGRKMKKPGSTSK